MGGLVLFSLFSQATIPITKKTPTKNLIFIINLILVNNKVRIYPIGFVLVSHITDSLVDYYVNRDLLVGRIQSSIAE